MEVGVVQRPFCEERERLLGSVCVRRWLFPCGAHIPGGGGGWGGPAAPGPAACRSGCSMAVLFGVLF